MAAGWSAASRLHRFSGGGGRGLVSVMWWYVSVPIVASSMLVPSSSGGRGHPGMVEQTRQVKPVLGSDAKATSDQLLTFRWDVATEVHLGVADLLVLLKGDVALHHVVEEDAQGPDGERVSLVSRASDPFWGSVYSGACREIVLDFCMYDTCKSMGAPRPSDNHNAYFIGCLWAAKSLELGKRVKISDSPSKSVKASSL